MRAETTTHDDVLHLFGPIDEHLAKEVLALQPTAAELEVAAAYVSGMTDVMGEARRPLEGKAARIYEIVSREDDLNEDEVLRS